ncbi:uncharacterized protein B0T15DRAFT_198811 [Chaetomium strumarium]|uniref:Uncharacterized protein n=1 Tax=Chaetomium strumarium TaxID=1170767 RepID=A0AAJ0GSU6_9PEZI|nr:hypothetical protein B0T15DRAFT_198811 [Chaetomium strumarium]
MLPFLEVSHLPSSSPFYSAVIQPLGLRYLSTEGGHFPSIVYGNTSRTAPVFQIRQVVSSRDRPLRTSRIVLSAPSPAAADHAYEFALLQTNLNGPDAHPSYSAEGYVATGGVSAQRTSTRGGGIRVLITDFDGNMLEIVYQPPPDCPSDYGRSTVRYTKSTSNEASRILDWNYDLASSSLTSSAGPSSSSCSSGASVRTASRRPHARYTEDDDQLPLGPRRSVTAGPSVYEPAVSARENSNGLSAGAVVGTLLGVAGVALGGAFAYNMVRGDKSRASRQAYDVPPLTRWSTYPERYDAYSDRKARYADVERGVEKVRYESDYPPLSDYRRPPPEYIARYSEVESSPRSKEADDVYDHPRGRHPSSRPRASSSRPRSESASYREPYAGGEAERRSYMSSRSSRHPPIVQRSYTYEGPDLDSYASARSHRSNSTVRAPPPDPYAAPAHLSSHSRLSTRATTRTIEVVEQPRAYMREGSYISGRNAPLPDSRAPTYLSSRNIPLAHNRATSYISPRSIPLPTSRPATYVSDRHVPLPVSHVLSGHARWEEDDDDVDSIAPSDSISCVGSRRSGRY